MASRESKKQTNQLYIFWTSYLLGEKIQMIRKVGFSSWLFSREAALFQLSVEMRIERRQKKMIFWVKNYGCASVSCWIPFREYRFVIGSGTHLHVALCGVSFP